MAAFPAWCVCEGKAKLLLRVLDNLRACVLWGFPGAVPVGLLGCQTSMFLNQDLRKAGPCPGIMEQQDLAAMVAQVKVLWIMLWNEP